MCRNIIFAVIAVIKRDKLRKRWQFSSEFGPYLPDNTVYISILMFITGITSNLKQANMWGYFSLAGGKISYKRNVS
jgi:hypothetical protein